jgi:hypothetical protein
VIPNNVVNIGLNAFGACTLLENIILLSKTPVEIKVNAFYPSSDNIKFYCHSVALESYKNSSYWKNYKDKIIADDLRLHFTNSAIA